MIFDSMQYKIKRLVLIFIGIMLTGCSIVPAINNTPISSVDDSKGYRVSSVDGVFQTDDHHIMLAFSGGV